MCFLVRSVQTCINSEVRQSFVLFVLFDMVESFISARPQRSGGNFLYQLDTSPKGHIGGTGNARTKLLRTTRVTFTSGRLASFILLSFPFCLFSPLSFYLIFVCGVGVTFMSSLLKTKGEYKKRMEKIQKKSMV